MLQHKKAFGVYHWDTFEPLDEDTSLVAEADTLAEAERLVSDKYGLRIRSSGADRVDIVNQDGDIVRQYKVG
jgi:hypothetical protein